MIVLLPLGAALACLALNRFVASRWCAFGAALAALASAALLVAARPSLPLTLIDLPWLVLDERPIRLALVLSAGAWPLALTALAGGALGLAGLGVALPAGLRGYAGLPAALLVVIALALAGATNQELALEPGIWMLMALAAGLALRSSGAAGSEAPLVIGLSGGLATVLALASALLLRADAPAASVACALLGALLIAGVAPLHAASGAYAEAPASVSGVLVALGLPLLGGMALVRIAPDIPDPWRSPLALLGMLSLLACAAGAVREHGLRRLVVWQHGAQQGLILAAAARGGQAVVLLLVIVAALSTLAACLAAAVLEQRGGGDDLAQVRVEPRLAMPGLALLVAGAAAVGAPGTLGLWGRTWLLPALADSGWLVAGLLAGSALLAASYVAPVAALWRGASRPRAVDAAALPGGLAALALLGLGAAPSLLASPGPGAEPGAWGRAASLIASALIILAPIGALALARRRPADDPDMRGNGAALPDGLGASLAWLAPVAAPTAVLGRAWELLLALSHALSVQSQRLEQRYYLAGLLIALIVVILAFI